MVKYQQTSSKNFQNQFDSAIFLEENSQNISPTPESPRRSLWLRRIFLAPPAWRRALLHLDGRLDWIFHRVPVQIFSEKSHGKNR